jgi:hypothetical protein
MTEETILSAIDYHLYKFNLLVLGGRTSVHYIEGVLSGKICVIVGLKNQVTIDREDFYRSYCPILKRIIWVIVRKIDRIFGALQQK